jgi:hypothetical protein
MALRGGSVSSDLPYGVDTIGRLTQAPPDGGAPAFQSPIFYNTTVADLLNAQAFLRRRTSMGDRRI